MQALPRRTSESRQFRFTGRPRRRRVGPTLAAFVTLSVSLTAVAPSPAQAAASDSGQWSRVFDWKINPLHMVLTPGGDVLGYGTLQNGNQGGQLDYVVWDPASGTNDSAVVVKNNPTRTDLFCSLQVIDPVNDVVLTAGGDNGTGGLAANPEVTTYSDATGAIAPSASMNYTRWYPTGTVMPNGDIIAQGGSLNGVDGTPISIPEVYSADTGWRALPGADSDYAYDGGQRRWWYPRAWAAPNGQLFSISGSAMWYLDPTGDGEIIPAGTFPGGNIGATSTAVMYRPGLILQAGGGAFKNGGGGDGSRDVTIVDIRSGAPKLSSAAPMRRSRHWANSTVLPDGTVLVTGGARGNNADVDVRYRPELWDPDTNAWTLLEPMDLPRLYHSTALLLPDATVLVGGGGSPGPVLNRNAQVFSPPYLFDGNRAAARPTITSAPSKLAYGQTFDVRVGGDVDRFTLVRHGAVTHSFNTGQRFIELSSSGTGRTRRVTAPDAATTAPPGSYMLFAIDTDGTPSVAAMVEIDPVRIDNPTADVPRNAVVSFESLNFPGHRVRHQRFVGRIDQISTQSGGLARADATFVVRDGLASGDGVSFESVNKPGLYLRAEGDRVNLRSNDGSTQFANNATFRPVNGLNGSGTSFLLWRDQSLALRHRNFLLRPESGDSTLFRNDASFSVDGGLVDMELRPGARIGFESTNLAGHRIRHRGYAAYLDPVDARSGGLARADSSFVVRDGLAGGGKSFESLNYPGFFLRAEGGRVYLRENDGSGSFASDATFETQAGLNGTGTSLRLWRDRNLLLRHDGGVLRADPLADSQTFKNSASFTVRPSLAD